MAVWTEQLLSSLPTLRLDPEYYQPGYLKLSADLDRLNPVRLGDRGIAYVTDGIHGSPDVVETDGIRYLSAKCVKDNFFVLDGTLQISKTQDAQNARTRPKIGDLLVTTVGTIGNAAVVTEDILPANTDRHLGLIRLNETSGFDPYFVSTFLNSKYGRFQSLREATGNVQLNLFIEKIKLLKIPRLSCMDPVAERTRASYAKRRESQTLYEQAENLLVEELGLAHLDLSPQLFYERRYSETVAAHRLDAEYFQPKYYRVEKAIRSCGHQFVRLGSIIEPIRNGFDFRSFGEGETPYIRVGDVGNGIIDIENAERIPISINELKKNVRLKLGDVLLTRKGSYGNAAVVRPGQETAIISSEMMLLRLKDLAFLPDYLAIYLNSPLGFQQIERRVHGVAFYSISQPDLADVLVINAPLSLQKRIERHVQNSLAARQESQRLLADAKRMVEDAILAAGSSRGARPPHPSVG